MPPLRPLLLCGLLLGAGCAPKPEPLKAVAAPKLGLTLSVPAHWQESDSYLADDNRFGLVEGGTDGVVMVVRRSPGLSIPRRYPHANGRALSLQLLQTSAPPGGLLKAEEITIAGQRVHCSIEAADRPFPMKILRVMFWNDTDTYDVSAAVRADRFAAKEAACKAALQSIAYAAPARIAPVLREGELSILAALPVSLSAYAAGAAAGARREPSGVPGLPGDIQRIRVQGELGWYEVLARGDEILQVRRKIVFLPGPNPGVGAMTIVVMDLERATGVRRWSPAFLTRLRDVLQAFQQGLTVDAHLDEAGVSVWLRKVESDLIVEYGPAATQSALEAARRAASQLSDSAQSGTGVPPVDGTPRRKHGRDAHATTRERCPCHEGRPTRCPRTELRPAWRAGG